jgi:hypothetical protein
MLWLLCRLFRQLLFTERVPDAKIRATIDLTVEVNPGGKRRIVGIYYLLE